MFSFLRASDFDTLIQTQ